MRGNKGRSEGAETQTSVRPRYQLTPYNTMAEKNDEVWSGENTGENLVDKIAMYLSFSMNFMIDIFVV